MVCSEMALNRGLWVNEIALTRSWTFHVKQTIANVTDDDCVHCSCQVRPRLHPLPAMLRTTSMGPMSVSAFAFLCTGGARTFRYCRPQISLFLWVTAASEFQIFLFFELLLFCFHALNLACFHTSVWPPFYRILNPHTGKEFMLTHGRHNLYFKSHLHGCISFIEGRRLCIPALHHDGLTLYAFNVVQSFALPLWWISLSNWSTCCCFDIFICNDNQTNMLLNPHICFFVMLKRSIKEIGHINFSTIQTQ